MWQIQTVKLLSAINNLKRLHSFHHCLSFLRCKPFISSWERKKCTSLIPLKWKHTLSLSVSSLLTGKSVSCWRWKDCGLFNRENRTVSPSLVPVSSARHSHTATHAACIWVWFSVACTVQKIKSLVLLFKALKRIVSAVSAHRQWLSHHLHCVRSRVWPVRGSCWIGPC